jgi:hypothetical protein
MFQKNFFRKPTHKSLNELKKQRDDRIDQRRRKNPLRRLIPMRIDIDRKKRNIQHQTWHRNSRDLHLIVPNERQKILERKRRIELHKIINDKAYDRCYQPEYQAQPKVVFFEYHDFHVFSSLLLRT